MNFALNPNLKHLAVCFFSNLLGNGAHRWLQLQYLPTACHVDLPQQPLHNGMSIVFAGRYLPHLQCHAQSSKADH